MSHPQRCQRKKPDREARTTTRASEIGLGVNVIDVYLNSIWCTTECNSSRLGGSDRRLEGIVDGIVN